MAEPILLLSWGVPPLPTGSAVIVGNLARQFGAEEMVVAGEKPYGGPRVHWRDEWPRIVHVAHELPTHWRGSRWWRRVQVVGMLWRSLRLVRRFRCSAVMVVFPNEEFLLVGYLTALWRRLPLFAYFHNTYLENRRGLSRRFACWLQSQVFLKSRHVFVMSEGMVELYRRNYPGLKCSALVHSFNEDLPAKANLPEPHRPLRLTISGNINESCREAAVRFADAIAQMAGASLTILSGTPESLLREIGMLRDGTHYATVSRDELVGRLQQADIVVLPHGFAGDLSPDELATMFPTKTIEYLICGRPILAHAPPDCFLTRFLKQHQCALVVDTPSVPALIDAVERLKADERLRARLVERALRTAEMFHAPRVAQTLRSAIREYSYASNG